MSSINSDDSNEGDKFDWNKYLKARNAEEVPEDFFHHVCKSELNGIELGSVIEVENEDSHGYWFASVCSSKGVLINLHYFGYENDKYDFWLEVKSPRIHPLNWGNENNKTLVPPYPDRYARLNSKYVKEKVQDCENILSKAVLQLGGASIYNVFKTGMFVEVQDKEYPYRVWISKVLKNVGGRLLLQMQGEASPEKNKFWLFYLNERIFPLGWAEQKGLPWRVMNLETDFIDTVDSHLLLNVLKPKTPEQHSFKVGEMLEVINPYSLMVFYVATIVKIYDNRYFKVEVDNEEDVDKRFAFIATKENPYLFSAGWASNHKLLLKPPSDWKTSDIFCWSKYIYIKNAKLANIDSVCKKNIDNIDVGMKLEAVDPINPDIIRVATVEGFLNHWMILSFDRTSWDKKLFHVRSIYSDDVFPVGWCNKHKYSLNGPKLPYANHNVYENYYYISDDEMDLNRPDVNKLINYPHFIKGDIYYHYNKKGYENLDYNSKDSLRYILNETSIGCSIVTNKVDEKKNVFEPIVDVKIESPELDEEFHDALFQEEEEEDTMKKENTDVRIKETIPKNSIKAVYEMIIYFNKNCYSGTHTDKKKISHLPISIGPGPVSKILQKAITTFINLDFSPGDALKKIKKIQHMLFDEPGGVEMLISTNAIKGHPCHSEYLVLPESKKMAQTYCSALCNLSGICEYFMTTEESKCPRNCNIKENITPKLKYSVESMPKKVKVTKKKAKSIVFENSDCSKRRKIINENFDEIEISDFSDFMNSNSSNIVQINEEIENVDATESIDSSHHVNSFSDKHAQLIQNIFETAKKELNWSNKHLVKRYKRYLSSIVYNKAQLMKLQQSFTPLELALITEIHSKKNYLRIMDENDIYSNTKLEVEELKERHFVVYDDWKSTFENYYRQDPRFKEEIIDIGHFEMTKVTSNPKYWSPFDVFKYISSDLYCRDIGMKLLDEEFDGVSFMQLNEEHLFKHLHCSINTLIRMMCHIAEVKFVFLTKYVHT